MFAADHLAKLLECNEQIPWKGGNLRSWASYVRGDQIAQIFPDNRYGRTELHAYCNGLSSPLDKFTAIAAWGGMNRKHGLALLECDEQGQFKWFLPVAEIMEGLSSHAITPLQGYEMFWALRKESRLPGMGPAYYTKLLYFCAPPGSCFIMDQWTSKSHNLLSEGEAIELSRYGYVTDRNDASVYARYNDFIERLARELCKHIPNMTPDRCEERIFSSGGKKPAPWRSYVQQKWRTLEKSERGDST